MYSETNAVVFGNLYSETNGSCIRKLMFGSCIRKLIFGN